MQENNAVNALFKIIRLHKIGMLLVAIGLPILLMFTVPGSGWVKWLIVFGLSSAGILLSARVLLHVLILMFNGGDIPALTQAAVEEMKHLRAAENGEPQVEYEELHLTILKTPEKPIARYMDADIYEELDLIDENSGIKYKGTYHNTINIKQGQDYDLEPGFMIVEPGIVYALTLLEEEQPEAETQVDESTK